MPNDRDNMKAGLFVVVAIVLALLTAYTLSDYRRMFEPMQTVAVDYQLGDGLRGLKKGAPVTLGDVPIGAVRRIEDVIEPDDGRVTGQRIILAIPRRYPLFRNAVIELKAPLIGTGTSVNIRSVGDGLPHEAGAVIEGTVPGSVIAAQLLNELGIREEQRRQLQAIVANIETVTGTLRDDVPDISGRLKTVLDRADAIVSDAGAAVGDVRAAAHDLRGIVHDLADRRQRWFDRVESVTESVDRTMGRVRSIVEDKDPAVRETIDHVHAITGIIREQTLTQLEGALGRAIDALDDIKSAAGELKAFVIGQRPVLERTLANALLTTEQLKLAAIEIRRSPWRLMYRPDDKELSTDNLYDAARSFALAAGTLDATAQSLATYAARRPDDQARVQQMLEHLEALFGRFQEAEQSFWEALRQSPPPP